MNGTAGVAGTGYNTGDSAGGMNAGCYSTDTRPW